MMQWLVYSREHEGWWAPQSRGYTASIDRAGRYSKAAAQRICASGRLVDRGPAEFMHPDPMCLAALEDSHADLLAACETALACLTDGDEDDGEAGTELRAAVAKAHGTAPAAAGETGGSDG